MSGYRKSCGAACALVLGLSAVAFGSAAFAQGGAVTAQTLVDRQQIEDLLTRYAYNLGVGTPESYAAFYAEDGQLIFGATTYTGREEIAGVYAGIGTDGPSRQAYSFNVSISNPLITVDGDTATAKLIYTEIVIDEQGDTPRLLAQGREFDTFVKVDGQWLIQTRRIMGGRDVPEGWAQ
jgi:hypothetical protein